MNRTSLDELLAHAGWMKGLARRLIQEDAEDLVQDVWVQAAQHPPRGPDSPRGWLATVLRNRAFNQTREGKRRRRREEVVTESLHEGPSTPQELSERMDLQHKLAALIAELPDDLRQVVHLRFVEDRSSAEIARLLQQPAGTIRWRLHEALARLRADLDQRGGRRAWIRALAPLAGWRPDEAETAARSRPRGKGGAVIVGAASLHQRTPGGSARFVSSLALALLVVGATALLVLSIRSILRPPADELATGTGGPPAAALRAGGPPPDPAVPQLTAALAASGESLCAEVEPMRRYVDELSRAADGWLELPQLYQRNVPNPALEAIVGPILAAERAHLPAGCEHALSCRGMVCEGTVLAPEGLTAWDCQLRPAGSSRTGCRRG